MKKKCQTCKGIKTIMGLGFIREKCKNCGGAGFIEEHEVYLDTSESTENHNINSPSPTDKPKRRRGRPPKKKE